MALILFDKDAVIDYIPEWGGNRESESPFVVKLKYIAFGKMRGYAQQIDHAMKTAKDDSDKAEKALEIQKRQFIDNVAGFENIVVEGRAVTDPAEFYELAAPDLVYEILAAMQDFQKLRDNQRKNSQPPFAGS